MVGKDQGKGTKKLSTWRGKSRVSAPIASHGWQDERDSRQSRLTRQSGNWRRIAVLGCFVFGTLGTSVFIAMLLQREVQFPFVAIVQTTYPRAFPPNAWAYEDLDSLQTGSDALDRKTIDVVDLTDTHRSNESLLLISPDQRRRAIWQARRAGVIVFYLSLHGLVNDSGDACVATSDSDPLNASTWLPVTRLLSQIQDWNLPREVHKLLILDCNRQETNWAVGLLENSFAARLLKAFEAISIPNLVILNSTSPGQIGCASAELRGSVFGQFLRLGLAGAADLPHEGGNHDHRVSVTELHRYLQRHVDSWAQSNRGVRQQPLMIPSKPSDFKLTCSLDRVQLDNLLARFASGAAAEPAVSRNKLDELWTVLSELRSGHADSFAPLEMGEFRRRLVWLEQASQSGAAYRMDAIAAEGELRRLSTRLSQRIKQPISVAMVSGNTVQEVEYHDPWVAGLAPRLHSLPMLARFGNIESTTINAMIDTLRQLKADASFEKLDAILSNSPTKTQQNSLGIVHFLRLAHRSMRLRGVQNGNAGALSAALDMQSLSDAVPVSIDPRIQFWIRGVTDAADAARRRADDALLTGAADSGTHELAEQLYREAQAIDKTVREALMLTDLMIAELPDLIRWLEASSRPRPGATTSQIEPESDILNLISAMHLLLDNLDSPANANAAATSTNLTFLTQYHALLAKYQSLRQRFDDACERFGNIVEATPDLVGQAAFILEFPLISSRVAENGLTPLEQRRKIQTWYLQASRDLNRRSIEKVVPSNAIGRPNLETASREDRNHVASLEEKSRQNFRKGFPVLAFLEPVDPASTAEKKMAVSEDPTETPESVGAHIRRILQSVPREFENARERHLTSPDQPRQEWNRAARMARCWVPFMTSMWQTDPVAELRRTDIQQLMLWQAHRSLEDFWGPVIQGGHSYFESAATDSIEAARLICIPNPATEKQISGLKTLMAARQKAARSGLVVQADALLLVDLIDSPTARVSVTSPVTGSGANLPPGTGLLRIADQNGNLLGPVINFPIEASVPIGDSKPQELQLSLGTTQRELSDTIGAATAVFRGHEFRDDLVIKTAAGTTIETRPHYVRNASVRLNGEKRQRASVVFILDCSASMQKGMPFESAEITVSRMEVAKAALVRMMNLLAARGDARVGVLLYGHRVGWNTKQPNQLMTQPNWGEAIPEGLKPFEDVQTILPLGRFDNLVAAKVAQQLERVIPWGETPLYLSLNQALLEFKAEDSDTQRSIVVITDGMNYQFNPPAEMSKTAQDVLNADASRHIPLHIVGFGLQADEAQSALRDFNRLATETGGQYVSVTEAAALADALEGIIERRPYSTSSLSGEIAKAPVGTAIDLAWGSNVPQEYTIAIDALSEHIELSGGEAVELFISQDGLSILSGGYDAGSPIFGTLVGGSPTDPMGVRLGVHLPKQEGNTVTFELSLQQVEQRFLRRPREIWIEITPILEDQRPATNLKYVIYDPEFVPRTSVPVLRAVARAWPKEAKRARVEFWCKWTLTEPSLVIPFSKLPEPGQPATIGIALDGVPGLKYQLRRSTGTPLRVDVIETYSPDVSGGAMLKVDVTGSITPSRTLHQFDEANRFATHSFIFNNASENLLDSSDAIRIVSRRRMFDNALHLEVPVLIDVPSQAETLSTSP